MPFSPDDRFQLLLQATAAGYWELVDGELVMATPELWALYGIDDPSHGNAVARAQACVEPAEFARLIAAADAARAHHAPYAAVVRIRRENDGQPRVLRVRGRAFTEDGHTRSLGTVVDITEERLLQDSLDELRRQLEDAEQLAGIGSWSWNIATGAVQWSKETYRILRVPFDTTPSFDLVLAAAADDANKQQFLVHLEEALSANAPYDFEIDARRADATAVRIHTRGSVERNAEGEPIRMVGTMQDVTEIRAAQQALIHREARFRTLAESSPMGIVLTNDAWVPSYANQRLLDWFGLSLEQYARGEWRTRVHPEDRRRVVDRLRAHMHPPKAFDDEYRIVVDDRVRWLKVRTEPLRDADGITVGLVGSMLDTSAERFASEERARLQAQLQQAQKLESLGLLAGGIAHDFNNLLVGILANASVARADVVAGSPAADVLADIESAAQRAAELTRQLLEYGGRAQMLRQPVDLLQVARELPALLRARIPARVLLQIDGKDDDGRVHGDETQLRQVLMNLVTNAVDAIGDADGRVTVRVMRQTITPDTLSHCLLGADRPPGDYIVISVDDTGHGISPAVRERMFDPFFTTKASGRGLGLAATLGILNSHGGAIDVQSLDGQGTRVCIMLPVATSAPRGAQEVNDDASLWHGSGIVLLVDDDVAVRTAARRALTRAGYQVIEAGDGAQALAAYDAHQGPLACVVLDVAMPVMTGDACLHELRTRDPKIRALLSTGYDAADVARRIVERGEATFLQKPYTATELLRAVRETIG